MLSKGGLCGNIGAILQNNNTLYWGFALLTPIRHYDVFHTGQSAVSSLPRKINSTSILHVMLMCTLT